MSRSTLPTTQRADDSGQRFAQEPRREGKWFWLSLLLHGVGMVALVLLTPVGDVLLAKSQPKQADLMLTQERAQQLADQIRDLSAEDLQQRVESLQWVDIQMEQLRVEQRSKLTEEQVQADVDAPAKALEAMQWTVEEMVKSAGVMKQQETHEAVDAALKAVSEKQDHANEALMSAGMEYDQVRRAQKQAIVEQLETRAWQEQMEQKEREIESLDKQIERAAVELERASKTAEATESRLVDTNKRLEETKAKLEHTVGELKRTQEQIEAVDKTDAKAAAQSKTLDRQREAQEKTEKRLDAAVKQDGASAARLAEQLQAQQKQVAERRKKAEELEENKRQTQRELERATEQRVTQQEEAIKSQEQAIDALKTAIAKATTEMVTQDATPPEAASTDTVQPLPQRPTTTDPVKLYQQARMLEEKITDSYREVRAVELAKIQNMRLAEAMARVDVPEPVREPVDKRVLDSKVKTAGRLQEYKKELAKVDQHLQSMQMSADAMLSAAQQVSQGFANELAAAMTIQRQQQLDELALENAGQVAVDMTGLMKGEAKTQGQAEGQGAEGERLGQAAGGQGAGAGRRGVGHGYPQIPKEVVALPGRSVGVGGVKSDWMYLDSWWMVGPFANPERKNIHQKFAPETVVDLDAVYVGEGGRPIRWEYVQSRKVFIMPPGKGPYEYSIWYAYTEVRFDQATDMWIAVGSDDRSDVWINGQKVWGSSDELKIWRVDEGYRKVHFQKGVNRVLYRIENGWRAMGFSMMLHTAPLGSISPASAPGP